MQTLDFFSGLHSCLELSQPLSCLGLWLWKHGKHFPLLKCMKGRSVLCYLPHIERIKHNNDLENHAVCRGNQHCLYYVLKLGKQHSTGVEYPSSCNTRQAEHVSATSDTRRPEKTSPISAQEIWVGTKVGYGCRALLLGP